MPDPSTPPRIRARALTKCFGALTAADAIDFDLAPGESFGFLGLNGAGKTSAMRMIARLLVSDGELSVLGMDPRSDGPRIRARLGVMPQQHTLDQELTIWENLAIYGRYFDLPRRVIRERVAELLDFVQLSERARDQVEPLSGGMKRRLKIARSLINEPDLLLLDEPTTGLDPQARHLLRDRLYRLEQKGVTIVLTTHYMDEAEQLGDRLVVMDKAKIWLRARRAGSSSSTAAARSWRCASRSASRRRSTGRSKGWAIGWSGFPIACSCTRTMATRLRPPPTSAACGRR